MLSLKESVFSEQLLPFICLYFAAVLEELKLPGSIHNMLL